jgi:hypothetical protein
MSLPGFPRARLAPLLLLVLLVGLAGCGRSAMSVTGTVRYKGQPLPGANVTFIPQDTKGDTVPVAVAITDASGNFQLQSRSGARDQAGVVPGEYRVAVSRYAPPAGMSEQDYQKKIDDEEAAKQKTGYSPVSGVPPKEQMIPAEYADPAKTRLTASVKPGSLSFTFDIP